jgi:hypothetical protein
VRVHGMPRNLAMLSSVFGRLFQDGKAYLAELHCGKEKKRKEAMLRWKIEYISRRGTSWIDEKMREGEMASK